MYRVELYVCDYGSPRLDEFRFFSDNSAPLVTVNSGSPAYCIDNSRNLFTWTSAVKALTLLLLKASMESRAVLRGDGRTPAASLDYALSKEPGWMIDFFGITGQGSAIARNIFGRRNAERKRPGPVEIYISESLLPSGNIKVFVNGHPATDVQKQTIIASLGETAGSELVTPTSEHATTKRVDRPSIHDYPMVAISRKVSYFADYANGTAHVEMQSTFRNDGLDAISYFHCGTVRDPNRLPKNFRIQDESGALLEWEDVLGTEQRTRLLVRFRQPLQPGAVHSHSISYDQDRETDLEGDVKYLVRYPTESFTLEFRCSTSHEVIDARPLGELDNSIYFTSLPAAELIESPTGIHVARWHMTNPTLGASFRLFWGVREIVGKPALTSRSAVRRSVESALLRC